MNLRTTSAGIDRIAHLCAKGGDHNPRLAAIRLAEETLSNCTALVPPVDVEELCRFRKVTAVKVYLRGLAARLVAVGDHYVAEINARHPETRRRFSICHELGHTLFEDCPGSEGNGDLCADSSYVQRLEERLCDTVAAELLMPRHVFSNFVLDCQPSMDAVRRIGEAFRVSKFAVARRVVELNLWPAELMLLRRDKDNKMRLQGYWSSKSLQTRTPLSTAIREISSQDRLSGRLTVPFRLGELALEYYTFGARPHVYVCSMLLRTSLLAPEART